MSFSLVKISARDTRPRQDSNHQVRELTTNKLDRSLYTIHGTLNERIEWWMTRNHHTSNGTTASPSQEQLEKGYVEVTNANGHRNSSIFIPNRLAIAKRQPCTTRAKTIRKLQRGGYRTAGCRLRERRREWSVSSVVSKTTGNPTHTTVRSR